MVKSTIDWFLEPNLVSGWIYDDGKLFDIEVKKNERIIGIGKNNSYRNDLESSGFGSCAFTIETTENFSYYDVMSGNIKVFYIDNNEILEVFPRSEVLNSVKFKIFSCLLNDMENMKKEELEIYLYNEKKFIKDDLYYAQVAAISSINNNKIPMPTNENIHHNISKFYAKVGTTSPDLQCEVGRDGNLFLTKGSNNVLEIYKSNFNSDRVKNVAEKWISLIKKRIDFCREIDSKFIEVIIPDKLSGMREYYDGVGSSISPILSKIENDIILNDLSDYYVSGFSAIEEIGFPKAFRKIDTHFSPEGGYTLFKKICKKICPSYSISSIFNIDYISTGDIGKRIFGQDIYEICTKASNPSFYKDREILEQIWPKPGKFTGGRTVFKNNNAPFAKKVVGFGNSFMNDFQSQASLGYWFSTFFQEFHLLTQADVDLDYIKKVNPDVVIGQTVERFLAFTPSS